MKFPLSSKILTLLVLFAPFAFPQASQSTARAVVSGASLPATCNPGPPATGLFYLTTGTTGLYECTSTNTWTKNGGGGSVVLPDIDTACLFEHPLGTIGGSADIECVTTAVSAPSAPAVGHSGTAGMATWSYTFQVLTNLGWGPASPPGSTATGNATLTSMNFNTVTPACPAGLIAAITRTVSGGTPSSTGPLGDGNGVFLSPCNTAFHDTGFDGFGLPAPDLPHTQGIYSKFGIVTGPYPDFNDPSYTGVYPGGLTNAFLYTESPAGSGTGGVFGSMVLMHYRSDSVINTAQPLMIVGVYDAVPGDGHMYGETIQLFENGNNLTFSQAFLWNAILQVQDSGGGASVLNSGYEYQAQDAVVGPGGTIHELVGFHSDDLTAADTTNTGFESEVTPGAGKLSFYDSGGAGIASASLSGGGSIPVCVDNTGKLVKAVSLTMGLTVCP